jgi:hypothetical protein
MANIWRIGHYSPPAISLFAEGEQEGGNDRNTSTTGRSIAFDHRQHRGDAGRPVRGGSLCAGGAGTALRHRAGVFPLGPDQDRGPAHPDQSEPARLRRAFDRAAEELKPSTFQLFETDYASLPIPPTVAAYLFTYAEFVLPICLVLGFATRFAALGLLVMTALMQIYVLPGMWWAAHVYWVSILMVLMSVGPGAISIDAGIRYLYERE